MRYNSATNSDFGVGWGNLAIRWYNTAYNPGGGMRTSVAATLTNVLFLSNTSRIEGGGLRSNAGVVINGGSFEANSGSMGAGAYVSGTAIITDTTFLPMNPETVLRPALRRREAELDTERAHLIRISAGSVRLNSIGGRSPAASMSRTFVPERNTFSLGPCGHVLPLVMPSQALHHAECSNFSGVMAMSFPGASNSSKMSWAS